jgi:hypothetical protein
LFPLRLSAVLFGHPHFCFRFYVVNMLSPLSPALQVLPLSFSSSWQPASEFFLSSDLPPVPSYGARNRLCKSTCSWTPTKKDKLRLGNSLLTQVRVSETWSSPKLGPMVWQGWLFMKTVETLECSVIQSYCGHSDEKSGWSWRQWLTPVIPATQEAEIRRMAVRGQPRQIVQETLSWKKPITKRIWWSGSRCRSWVQIPHTQKKKKKSGWN